MYFWPFNAFFSNPLLWAILVLFYLYFHQRTQIMNLQEQMTQLLSGKNLEALEKEEEVLETAVETLEPESEVESAEAPSDWKWEEFFTKKFFAVLGALSVVLAIGFFSVWAFSHGLIGPAGRIALGILFSLAFLVAGEMLRERVPKFFSVLSSVGIAGLIIVTFIAKQVYGFLSPQESFIAYVVEVLVGVFLSIRYNSRILGNFSICSALVAPALVRGEPNEMGLLIYLSVLSGAGFLLSLRQRWPEILAILLCGVWIYEGYILVSSNLFLVDAIGNRIDQWVDGATYKRFGFVMDSPVLFLAFSGFMHWILGLGGILRAVLFPKEYSEKSAALEMILMILSIVIFNGLAAILFDWKDWPYLGFFILFQGFMLFGLSDWLKGKGLLLFQKIALSGTLISVLLATILEIGRAKQDEFLAVALVLEGILMLYGSTKLSESLLGVFGKIALVIGSFLLFEVSVGWGILLVALYFLGIGISFQGEIKLWEKVLSLIALIWFLVLLQLWNLDIVKTALGLKWDFLLYICPSLTALILGYSVLKVRQGWISVVSLVHFAFWNLILNSMLYYYLGGSLENSLWDPTLFKFIQLLVWVWVVGTYFLLIMSVFSEEKGKAFVSDHVRLFVLRGGLFCATLFTLFHAARFSEEPWTTLLWGAWAGLLLTAGNINNWKNFRYAGIAVFCLIIAKLYLIDVWQWNTGTKVIAFSALGLCLLLFSFLAQKKSKS